MHDASESETDDFVESGKVAGSSKEPPDESSTFVSSLEHEADGLWKQNRPVAIATLALPLWVGVLSLAGAFVWGGATLARQLIVATVASAAAGRFVIWTGAEDHPGGFSPFQLALLVLGLDSVWAIVLTWHAGVLFRMPWVGERLRMAVQEGGLLLKKNRWMKRLTLLSVFGFVMLPVSSTGSIGGSLLGRLLGLSRVATLATVLTGSLVGGGIMLAFAEALSPWFQNASWTVRYGGIGVIVLIGLILSRRYRRSLHD